MAAAHLAPNAPVEFPLWRSGSHPHHRTAPLQRIRDLAGEHARLEAIATRAWPRLTPATRAAYVRALEELEYQMRGTLVLNLRRIVKVRA